MRKLYLFMLSLVVGVPSPAFGWSGTLDRPLIGYSDKIDANRQKKAQIALTFLHGELKFVDGQFFSTIIKHRFGGTFQKTSRFIELLHDSDAWKLRVQFKNFGEQNTAIATWQNMGTEELVVTVNSGRNDFRLKDFQAWLPKPPRPTGEKPASRQ